MRISSVVINSSLLVCMTKAGIIEILPALFEDIAVPEAVKREILVKEHTPFKRESLDPHQWMRLVNDIPLDPRVASWIPSVVLYLLVKARTKFCQVLSLIRVAGTLNGKSKPKEVGIPCLKANKKTT